MRECIFITVHIPQKELEEDLEVPSFISVNDLIEALADMYSLKLNRERLSEYYLKSDHPKKLLRGVRTLKEMGLRDGTEVWTWNE